MEERRSSTSRFMKMTAAIPIELEIFWMDPMPVASKEDDEKPPQDVLEAVSDLDPAPEAEPELPLELEPPLLDPMLAPLSPVGAAGC